MTSQTFSQHQEQKISTIVQKELIPVKSKLGILDTKVEKLEDRLDILTIKVVEHNERLQHIETKIEELPSKSWIQEMFDHLIVRMDQMSTELRATSRSLMRHDEDIELLKDTSHQNTRDIEKLKIHTKLS